VSALIALLMIRAHKHQTPDEDSIITHSVPG